MNIFVTGLTSSRLGGMEFHNLGNFIIAEPMFRLLRQAFPEARVATSIQMSQQFYEEFQLIGCRHSRFWRYNWVMGARTALDVLRALAWKVTRFDWLLDTPLLSELAQADLVVDFSGDLYGDNTRWNNFIESNVRLMLARFLNKKVVMLFGSPGPFTTIWRLWIAKYNLQRLALITNREPMSTAMLAYVGISGPAVLSTACPSVFFEPTPYDQFPRNDDYRALLENPQPTFGMIICGWNMPVGPFDRWPREDWEFQPFVALTDWILRNTDLRVCVMSHQNATTPSGSLKKGNDHRIVDRFFELLGDRTSNDRLITLTGLYDAAQSKRLIGSFDVVMSGRIHGAVQALSQGIPTAIIDYGHEPKAHKLRGFAEVYGVGRLVADPRDAANLIETARVLVTEREQLAAHLMERLPQVRALAARNFELLDAFRVD